MTLVLGGRSAAGVGHRGQGAPRLRRRSRALGPILLLLLSVLLAPAVAQDAPKKSAWDLLRERDYARALEVFKKEVRLYPKNAALVDGMAWCEFFLGHYEEAEKGFREALEYDPEYKWSKQGLEAIAKVRSKPLEEAAALLAAGRYADARAEYQHILEGGTTAAKSSYPEATAGEGWCLYYLGNYAEAMKSFRKALKDRPSFAEAYRGIGYCEYARQNWTDALVALRMSFKSEPDNYIARLTAAWCLYWKKEYGEALKEFEGAKGSVAGPWGAHLGVGWCQLRLDAGDKALAAFESAVALSPYAVDAQLRAEVEARREWWHLFSALGWSALRARLDSWALTEFKNALQKVPGDPEALRGLAFAQYRLGDYKAALEAIEKALPGEVNLPPLRLPLALADGSASSPVTDLETLKAWTQHRLGRYDEALAGFRKVLAAVADRVEARCGEGWVLFAQGNYPAAEQAFADAGRLLPGYADAAAGTAAVTAWRYAEYNAAWDLYYKGSYAEAAKVFRDLLGRNDRRFPKERGDLLEASLGWAEMGAGNEAEAKAAFERALNLAPDLGLAHKGFGFLATRRGQHSEAASCLRKALQDPAFAKDKDVIIALGRAELGADRPDRAEAAFLQALAIDAQAAAAIDGLGWVCVRQNKLVDARVTFERAISIDPTVVDTERFRKTMAEEQELWKLYGSFGWAYFNRAAYDKGAADFQEALRRDPRERENQRGLGLTQIRQGKTKEGNETLKTYFGKAAAAKEPIWGVLSGTVSEWGWALYTAGQYGEAVQVFSRLLAMHAGEKVLYSDPHDGLGWCYLKQGRTDQAQKEFLAALVITPRYESSLKGLEALKQLELQK